MTHVNIDNTTSNIGLMYDQSSNERKEIINISLSIMKDNKC